MTSFEKLQRRIGGFPIEYPAAALTAASVVICMLMLPDWRFEAAINATGLPGIVSAAQPPLGTTARLLAALALAALSFAVVWFGLRALDAKPQSTDFPAFRAADLHPDAPRRRPILAGAEFGAPVDDLPSIEEQAGRRRPLVTEPLPSFLAPQTPEPEARRPLFSAEVVDRPEGVDPVVVEPAPAPLLKQKPRVEEDPFEEEARPVEIVEPVAAPSPVVDAAPVGSMPAFAEAAPIETARVETGPAEIKPSAVLAGDHDEDEESVSELMARLETGLSKREGRPVPSGSVQDELQRALGDLNRVSGRG